MQVLPPRHMGSQQAGVSASVAAARRVVSGVAAAEPVARKYATKSDSAAEAGEVARCGV